MAGSPVTRVRTYTGRDDKDLESLADYVVDLDDLSDVQITDVEEEPEPEPLATLCLAPPCNHKAEAVSLESLPVPWAMRIAPA